MVGKLVPDPFIKIKILAYLWIDSIKCYKVCFYCMFKSKSTAFTLYKTFFIKNKTSVELVPLRHFLADFWRKIFFTLCLIDFTSRDTSDMCIIIICCQVYCNVINFENNHSYQTVFVHNQEVRTKMQVSQERKELETWKEKHFSSFLKINCQILSDIREWTFKSEMFRYS